MSASQQDKHIYGLKYNSTQFEIISHGDIMLFTHVSIPQLMKLMDVFGEISGYSIKLSKGPIQWPYRWSVGWCKHAIRHIWEPYHQQALPLGLHYPFSTGPQSRIQTSWKIRYGGEGGRILGQGGQGEGWRQARDSVPLDPEHFSFTWCLFPVPTQDPLWGCSFTCHSGCLHHSEIPR